MCTRALFQLFLLSSSFVLFTRRPICADLHHFALLFHFFGRPLCAHLRSFVCVMLIFSPYFLLTFSSPPNPNMGCIRFHLQPLHLSAASYVPIPLFLFIATSPVTSFSVEVLHIFLPGITCLYYSVSWFINGYLVGTYPWWLCNPRGPACSCEHICSCALHSQLWNRESAQKLLVHFFYKTTCPYLVLNRCNYFLYIYIICVLCKLYV